jgi:hypothetical protein
MSDTTDKASQQTPRISQAAIKSFFCLFDKHCWEKLPNVKELLQLPDVQAIILKTKIKRPRKKGHWKLDIIAVLEVT